MLNITPKEILTFPQTNNSEVSIILCCNSVVPLIYKIQTTSPEKFRVRPRHGLLEPRQSVTINIVLRSEHRLGETTKDKFLILCMPAPLDRDLTTSQNIADIWKQRPTNSPAVDQHRLTCVYQNEGEGFCNIDASSELENSNILSKGNFNNNSRPNDNINELAQQTHKLQKQLKFTQFMQYLTLFILLLMSVAVVYLLRLEMDFSFLSLSNSTWSYRSTAPAQERLPLRTRLSHSFPKMGRLSRGSR